MSSTSERRRRTTSSRRSQESGEQQLLEIEIKIPTREDWTKNEPMMTTISCWWWLLLLLTQFTLQVGGSAAVWQDRFGKLDGSNLLCLSSARSLARSLGVINNDFGQPRCGCQSSSFLCIWRNERWPFLLEILKLFAAAAADDDGEGSGYFRRENIYRSAWRWFWGVSGAHSGSGSVAWFSFRAC